MEDKKIIWTVVSTVNEIIYEDKYNFILLYY